VDRHESVKDRMTTDGKTRRGRRARPAAARRGRAAGLPPVTQCAPGQAWRHRGCCGAAAETYTAFGWDKCG